ncbi:hypothetical protein DES53_12231 [Roseimicrobium gellanilyticum]|uniref:SpoIIAA-like protein n=1 Tax=Roseimicrobium gellanilyticum TaxID=748857 RepID=A0A366H0Y7_9BACT|nr:hypothetical protein [Roseimicrobium gellanilyticum]RBP35364.1 hypothetical protein DES53_12231 [Roseimicrobium gellanilyticum]
MLSEELEQRFPYARYHSDHRLVTWFPEGALTDERADQIVHFLELAEMEEGQSFDRYTDMTGHTRIQISLDHVVRIARRRLRYPGPPVKSAFYATRTISLSVARMYAELMEGSRIQVRTFRERAAAADWLSVPVAILNAPIDLVPV